MATYCRVHDCITYVLTAQTAGSTLTCMLELIQTQTLNELIADIDDKLFFQAMYNNCHVLNSLLPNKTHRTYNLRQRRRNSWTLLTKQHTVTESDFIVRMLYKDQQY